MRKASSPRLTMHSSDQSKSNDAGKINVGNTAFVLDPVIAIFLRASVFVAQCAMDDHDGEEGGVQVPDKT